MKIFKLFALCALLALLLVPAVVSAQEPAAPERGVVEFGFRGVTGTVYGRTDPGTVPFSNNFRPDVLNSGLNTYNDFRSAFYVPKFNYQTDSFLGSQSYFKIQSVSNGFAFENGGSLSRDLSALVTLGQYGHYKVQFRFDETPHTFSGTTRTLFSSNGAGGWSVNPTLQSALFNALCVPSANKATCNIASGAPGVSIVNNVMSNLVAGSFLPGVSGVQPFTQQENRKTGTGLFSWNLNPDVNISALFSREHQLGTRPIGFVMGASSGSYVAESPEAIDYYTNNVKVTSEFGRKHWDALLGYQGSFFKNNNPSMLVMNPFSNVYNNTSMGPATARMDLYPDNNYQQFVGQGAVDLGKNIHLMASITPGWMSQTANFQPLTTNTFVPLTPTAAGLSAQYPSFLPTPNLNGKVSTLAMNYTGVFKATKNLVFTAKYQHYDYNNNTPDLLVRPVVGDTSFLTGGSFHGSTAGCFDPTNPTNSVLSITNPTPGNPNFQYTYYCSAEQSGFNSKLFDVGGTWFFTKKDSVKFGYQRGWMDRTNREVDETIEGSFYGALDMHLQKHLLLRVSGRHQNRMPQGGVNAYLLDTGNVYARMPDQATRIRNRGDASLQWDATQKLSLSAFWGTLQDNFNVRDAVNSLTPLGDATNTPGTAKPTPIYGPYYAYGLLNNIGRNYGADVNYALTPKVVLFAEYGHEKNTGVIIQGKAGNPSGCYPSCDPINDFLTAPKDVVNSYYAGADFTPSKKLDVSLYYGLSLAQSFVFSDGVNCQISNTPTGYCFNKFNSWNLESGSPARTWNATTGAMLTPGTLLQPALTWSYPQNVNRVHEVGAIARFKLTQNLVPKFQYIFRQFANTDWQTGVINPYSFVGPTADPTGTSAMQKLLFLGADQPSYRAHVFSATLEYHF